MYGNLQEIDVNSLLSFISKQQKSGVLFIETESIFSLTKLWYFIFFNSGDIIFISDEESFNLQRLQEYLIYYHLKDEINIIKEKLTNFLSISEYEAILLLSQENIISINQEKTILKLIIEENLFKIISLTKGYFTWQENFNLQPLIIRFKLDSFLPKIIDYNKQWQELNSYIKYPEEYPVITNYLELKLLFNLNKEKVLWEAIDGKTTFLQLSRYLHENLATIGKIIYPTIEKGLVKVITPAFSTPINQYLSSKIFNILFITKDKNWAFKTESLLSLNKYNLLVADTLIKALDFVFNSSIDLIILDKEINENEANQLCKIIRNSDKFNFIPIILVVNEYIFKDNLILKIYGVTDYITKKIFNKNLYKILDKYL
ncbi:MAG: DUF4388 domain-containing protein [Cyanobacteria bacterium]|nr:DUF4388 domain-containing protein [Cyanobacteria bacterium CG_2015-16_32_12]NCO78411.1 DUF4388 domain-containing protein [Cyanobacteria bacterium CG_2015-22_32_23]NCQ03552.1 DUF4388 domain-containing protein [Cyanobacteria bacterium CG_2015-09_32_10]NCQ42036.1 DUF4388 domain-containing protein [Cyanobacteria bacterium CG_2015-04_32_10]NCS84413.1 DUF4388 domain-containing protein [Cyanobacteria bacterium CG_2015-02_32_10]